MGHVLFSGPAGVGKTSLAASVLPTELGNEARSLNCSSVDKPTDLTSVLTTTPEGGILFLDEVHALPPAAKEHLLTVMEDRKLYVTVGEGDGAQIMEIELPEFTIIGATTRAGLLNGPMRSRFSHTLTLQHYSDDEIAEIIRWNLAQRDLGISVADEALVHLAPACQGVARNAVNLVSACIDTVFGFEEEDTTASIHLGTAQATLDRLGFVNGFSSQEWAYLTTLNEGELGVNTLCKRLSEDAATIEEVYEPRLMRHGYVSISSRGRKLTDKGKKALL